MGKTAWELTMDGLERMTGVHHVVDQQDVLAEPRSRHRHMLRDDELATHRSAFGRIRMRRQYRERLLVNARQHIADAQAAARDADDLVERKPRFLDAKREALDERVVIVTADMQAHPVILVFTRLFHLNGCCWRIVSSRSGPVEIIAMRTFVSCSMRSRYARAFDGNAA